MVVTRSEVGVEIVAGSKLESGLATTTPARDGLLASGYELDDERTGHGSPSPRILGSGRVVALALIALVVVGLAYLRFGTGADPVSVPTGARAGDLIERCDYVTEDGSYEAHCGTLVVPEKSSRPAIATASLLPGRSRSCRRAPPWADRPLLTSSL